MIRTLTPFRFFKHGRFRQQQAAARPLRRNVYRQTACRNQPLIQRPITRAQDGGAGDASHEMSYRKVPVSNRLHAESQRRFDDFLLSSDQRNLGRTEINSFTQQPMDRRRCSLDRNCS